jgi:ABC-type uncharacterized transport system fused permease/ATPase subunit
MHLKAMMLKICLQMKHLPCPNMREQKRFKRKSIFKLRQNAHRLKQLRQRLSHISEQLKIQKSPTLPDYWNDDSVHASRVVVPELEVEPMDAADNCSKLGKNPSTGQSKVE